MAKGLNIVGSVRSDGSDREKNDYYATDPKAIRDLNRFISIKGIVRENACGEGNLSKELEKIPQVEKVISSDLINRGYGEIIDFLNINKRDIPLFSIDWIITNPPYKKGQERIEKSLLYANNIAVLMKLVFLEGVDRYGFFKKSGLKFVLVYSRRLGVYKDNMKTKNGGLVTYAWFIFEKGYTGKATIDWIL